jgi:hypothetical protein
MNRMLRFITPPFVVLGIRFRMFFPSGYDFDAVRALPICPQYCIFITTMSFFSQRVDSTGVLVLLCVRSSNNHETSGQLSAPTFCFRLCILFPFNVLHGYDYQVFIADFEPERLLATSTKLGLEFPVLIGSG